MDLSAALAVRTMKIPIRVYACSSVKVYLPNVQLAITQSSNHYCYGNPEIWNSAGFKSFTSKDSVPTTRFSSDENDPSRDMLLEKIKSSSDTAEIFESIRLHLSIMNPNHLFITLNTLFQLDKSGNSRLSKEKVVKSPEFQILCKSILRKIPTFRSEDVVKILKCLIYFNVITKSKIMQGCLQCLASNINELSLANIIFLDFLINDLKPCPLIEALKISLPIVFQAQYLMKIDHESNVALIDMLGFATRRNLSEECTNKILNTLVERNNIEYTERTARNIVYSIASCKKLTSVHEILLNRTLYWISENVNKYRYEDIDLMTSRLVYKFVWVDTMFYHESFFNSVTQYLITNNIDFTNCIYILKKFARIHFVSTDLLEHIAQKAYTNPEQLENISPGPAISYVAALSDSCFKPPKWELISAYFLKNFEKEFITNDKLELPWIKIALEFASLDVWPSFFYEKIFESNFLDKFVREDNVLDYFQLLNLHHLNQTLNPTPYSAYPPQYYIEKAAHVLGLKKEYPLKDALEKGFGGSEYVQTKVFTKEYHFIDHVIAMRKGGFPIPINNDNANLDINEGSRKIYLEDIKKELPEGHYMIGICVMPASAYTLNTQRMRGVPFMVLKSLETCGIAVLPVNLEKWLQMPDHEKVPYLMRLIKTRESEDDLLLNHIC